MILSVGAAVLVLLLPGASVLAWLPETAVPGQTMRRDPLCFLADAAALSIAIDALLAMFLLLFGVALHQPALAVLYSVSTLLFVTGLIRRAPARRAWTLARISGALLSAAGLVSLVIWRLWQARALALPAWVDSVHHVFLVRKIMETGGLPPNLLPEIPATFSYHSGFHLIAALFATVASLSPAEAVLWFGQVLNAAVAVSVYRAAHTFQGDRPLSGLPRWAVPALAALLTGFVFQMPAYYLTWGRYPMLTGLLLLGPALAAAGELWQGRPGAGARLALLIGGLCLAHYFVLLLAALYLGLLVISGWLHAQRNPAQRVALLRLILWSVVGLALALPWLVRVIDANLANVVVRFVNPLAQAEEQQASRDYLRYIIYLLGPRHNFLLLGMSALGLLAALRRPALRLLASWALLLALLTLPWGLRLLVFRPDHFAIVLFFPASILLAHLLAECASVLQLVTHRAWAARVVLLVLGGLLVGWGMQQTAQVINPGTVIATQADLRALRWIEANTEPGARFWINSVFWQGRTYRGVDGGYWILPVTGRASLVPPAFYEMAGRQYSDRINALAERANQQRGCTDEFWQIVKEAGLTHIYLRAGVGTLQPSMLEDCAGLENIYHADGVFIYHLQP